jgi:hypothetical protein
MLLCCYEILNLQQKLVEYFFFKKKQHLFVVKCVWIQDSEACDQTVSVLQLPHCAIFIMSDTD